MLKILRDYKQILLLSFISPFLALVKLISYQSQNSFKASVVLGFIFFGLFFSYPDYSDGAEHLERSLIFYSDMSFSVFVKEAWNILLLKPSYSSEDFYIHFLCFISNSILGLPKSLHFFASIILGKLVTDTFITIAYTKYLTWSRDTVYTLVIIFVFGIMSLNAIRINTAMWMSLYGIVSFYKTNKQSYLLYVLLAAQIHISFYLIGLIPLVGFFLRNRIKFLIIFWLLSPLTPTIQSLPVVNVLSESELLEKKSKYYVLDEDRITERNNIDRDGNRFYKRYGHLWLDEIALPMLMLSLVPLFWRPRGLGIAQAMLAVYLLSHTVTALFPYIPSLVGRIHVIGNVSLLLGVCSIGITELEKMYKTGFGRNTFIFVNRTNIILLIPILLLSFSHLLNTTNSYFIIFPSFLFGGIEGMGLKDIFF